MAEDYFNPGNAIEIDSDYVPRLDDMPANGVYAEGFIFTNKEDGGFYRVDAAGVPQSIPAGIVRAPATRVETLAALKALDPAADNVYAVVLAASGRLGVFYWDDNSGGGMAANVTNDPGQGVYIAPDSDTSGASGAWVRQYDGPVNAKWFGATGDRSTDDTTALQRAMDFNSDDLIIPEGDYVTTLLTITTDNLHVKGLNARLVAKSGVMANSYIIKIDADFVTIDSLHFDNPDEQKSATGNRQGAIQAFGSKLRITNNVIRRCLMGIVIRTEGEYHENRIDNNYLYDMLGTANETRGDGIVSWGANTVIVGNIVKLKTGQDARIGIHVEALSAGNASGYEYPDRGATITGNIVLGKYRRGIACEDVKNTTIGDNFVADSTWYGIATTFGNGVASCTVTGNTIYWTRTAAETPGGSVTRSGIFIGAYSSVASGITIANNTMEIANGADADSGINIEGAPVITGISIIGNMINNTNGGAVFRGIASTNDASALIVHDNTVLTTTERGIYMLGPVNVSVCGNWVKNAGDDGIYIAAASNVKVNDNTVESNTAGYGIEVINTTNIVWNGNILINTNAGFEGFGSDYLVCTGNLIRSSGTFLSNMAPVNSAVANNLTGP